MPDRYRNKLLAEVKDSKKLIEEVESTYTSLPILPNNNTHVLEVLEGENNVLQET